ncbi:MAG: hypothetical protein DBX91_10305 [Subdoligranulum variabile]|nr:MAG: hypothetical protein DBX91_10305 [Subdoligranulum variabile]
MKQTQSGARRYGGMCASGALTGQGGANEAGRYFALPGMRAGIPIPRRTAEPVVPAVLPKSAEKTKTGGTEKIEIDKRKKRRAA